MECAICKKKIGKTFLGKIIGTYVRKQNGKKMTVCFECQKRFNGKEELINQL